MSTTQKKRTRKKNVPTEKFADTPQKKRTDDGGGDDSDVSEDAPLEPVFDNQYAISCGADEYIMSSGDDLTVNALRSYIQANRPNGMSVDSEMPCFINGALVEDENTQKLQGNLRIEFTKKAGVKGV